MYVSLLVKSVLVLIVAVSLLPATANASSCSINTPTFAEAFYNSDVVFTGAPTQVRDELKVVELYKAPTSAIQVGQTVKVYDRLRDVPIEIPSDDFQEFLIFAQYEQSGSTYKITQAPCDLARPTAEAWAHYYKKLSRTPELLHEQFSRGAIFIGKVKEARHRDFLRFNGQPDADSQIDFRISQVVASSRAETPGQTITVNVSSCGERFLPGRTYLVKARPTKTRIPDPSNKNSSIVVEQYVSDCDLRNLLDMNEADLLRKLAK